jgi:hypothetical protein
MTLNITVFMTETQYSLVKRQIKYQRNLQLDLEDTVVTSIGSQRHFLSRYRVTP